MSKVQLLVLLLIMTLVFYYLQPETKPAPSFKSCPQSPNKLISPSRSSSQPINSSSSPFPAHSPLLSPLPNDPNNELHSSLPPFPVTKPPLNKPLSESDPKTNLFTQLQADCANYLNWPSGNMVNNWYPYWEKVSQEIKNLNSANLKTQIELIIASLTVASWDSVEKKQRQQDLVKELEKLIPAEQPISPDEEYRTQILTLLDAFKEQITDPNLLATANKRELVRQAIRFLSLDGKPRWEYTQKVWSLRSLLSDFNTPESQKLSRILTEWINLPVASPPAPMPTDTGWLTDDNLEFILSNHAGIQATLAKQNQSSKKFHLRTDLANIYDNYQRMQTNLADETVLNFIQEQENDKHTYTLFPLRVNGNHWGLFILQDHNCTYQVYYTSSGWGIVNEAKQLQPLINLWVGENTKINLLKGDKQKDGYNCGVYLVKYIEEILETGKLELKRQYSPAKCQNFRWEWKERIGGKWCKWD